jgi:hypothetical protein
MKAFGIYSGNSTKKSGMPKNRHPRSRSRRGDEAESGDNKWPALSA